MKNIGLLLFAVLMTSSSAKSYELERAKANMAQDLMSCMSYYLWAKSFGNDNYSSQANDSAKWALNLAQVYEPSIQKLDAMAELATNEIVKVSKTEGTTRLVLTYAEPCKAMLEHPVDRFKYWQDKK